MSPLDTGTSGDGFHVVTLYTDDDGQTFAQTFGFDSKAAAKVRFDQEVSSASKALATACRRVVWLYEINPLDGRRQEVEAWFSDSKASAS